MLTQPKIFLVTLNVIACLSCIALAFYFMIMPKVGEWIYGQEYQEKMFVCDSAMRNHLIAKNRVKYEKSAISLKDLELAEVGLVHCHDYDVLRKKLIKMGLSNNDLALLGLEAIEKRSADIDRLVEIHEFKY